MWYVQFTEHDDAHRPSQGRWTETTVPKLFKSEASAREYLRKALIEHFNERVGDYLEESTDNWKQDSPLEQHMQHLDDEGQLAVDQKDMELLTTLVELIEEGEYVEQRWTWQLGQAEVEEEKHPKKKRKEAATSVV